MKNAVIVFPGSNCERDLYYALRDIMEEEVSFVDYRETSLEDYDVVYIPGGFSYGDYLRSGAIARFAPVMKAVKAFADKGGIVIGICNGFQILTEAGLLPGALHLNNSLNFICDQQALKIVNDQTYFTNRYQKGETIALPIAHGEGNYYCDDDTYQQLAKHHQIIFEYPETDNPNGSLHHIAGIQNENGNVMALMPHPERAVETLQGNIDGIRFFESVKESFEKRRVL